MVKKRSSSSSVAPKKSLTPKISFKKISPNRNAKKKQLTPFNKLILKKSNESKKSGCPSRGNIVEDENPREVSKEKKKKNPSKNTKEPKSKITGQEKNKIKPLKNLSSFGEQSKIRNNKNEELVRDKPPKKKKTDKQVKKKPVKLSSLSDKCAKITKTSVKMILKKDTKDKRNEAGGSEVSIEKSEMLSSGNENYAVHDRLAMSSPPKELTEPIGNENYAVNDSLVMRSSPKELSDPIGNENYAVHDSLVMSSPPKELSEPIVYSQGGGDEHSLGSISEAEYPNPDDAGSSSRSCTSPMSSFDFETCDWNLEQLLLLSSENEKTVCLGDIDNDSSANTDVLKINSPTPDINEENNQLPKVSHLNCAENEKTVCFDDIDNDSSANTDGLKIISPTSDINEENNQLPKDVSDSSANTDGLKINSPTPDINEENNQLPKDVSDMNCSGDTLPGRDCFGISLTPEKESSSSKRSTTVEDDLCLSTSASQCSSRSSVSLGSVDGLYELSKIKKSKKNLAEPLSSKLPLKRKRDSACIGEKLDESTFLGSSDYCTSSDLSSNESSDHSRKIKKRNLQESPQNKTDEIPSKRKRLQTKDSCSTPKIFIEPDHPRRFVDGNSQVSPKYHHKGLESPSSWTSESSTNLSPSKTVKIVVKRLEDNPNEHGKLKSCISIQEVKQGQISSNITSKQDNSARLISVNERDILLKEKQENEKSCAPKIVLKDCSVSLTKIDCELNEMKALSPSSSLKVLTTTNVSNKKGCNTNDEIELQAEKLRKSEKKIQHPILSNKHIISYSQSVHNSSAEVGLKVLKSTESSLQKAGRTYSRIVNEQKPIAKDSLTVNLLYDSLQNREKNLSPGITDLPIKNGSKALNLSGFSLKKNTPVSPKGDKLNIEGPAKKPRLCKIDLIKKRKPFLKTLSSDKSKRPCSYAVKTQQPESYTVDSPNISNNSPSRTIQQVGNILLPVRKIINANAVKSKSPVELPFKQPPGYTGRKVHNVIRFEDNESLSTAKFESSVETPFKQPTGYTVRRVHNVIRFEDNESLSTSKSESSAETPFKQPTDYTVRKVHNVIRTEDYKSSITGNIDVKSICNVTPVTQTPENHKINDMFCEKLAVKSTGNFPQCNRHFEKEEDDTSTFLSVFAAQDLVDSLDNLASSESTKTDNCLRGSQSNIHSRPTFLKNSLTKPFTAAQEISNGNQNSKIIFNDYANEPKKQWGVGYHASVHTEGEGLKNYKNQLFNSQKSSYREKIRLHDDVDEDEEEVNIKKAPIFRNNEVEHRRHINEFRLGNPSKPNVMEDQTESGFLPTRSRSNSSLSGSNNCYGSDNIPYENLLHGTPFDGYCLFYLRNSVVKNQKHQCDLKHEVPALLFQTRNKIEDDDLKRATSKGINRVCKENCENPPLRLLEGIIMFCIKNEQKHELTNVIYFLKNSISIDKVGLEKYKEVWTHFTKTLVRNIAQWTQNPATSIDLFLQKVLIDENREIGEATQPVLYDVLGDLAKMANNPSLKLLHCVKFLKDLRHPVNMYPISFIEAVLHQVLEANNENSSVRFCTLVYRTFFNHINDCRYLYTESKSLTEQFLTMVMPIGGIIGGQAKDKLFQLQRENGLIIESINPWGHKTAEHMNRKPHNTTIPQHQRSNFSSVKNFLDKSRNQDRLQKDRTPKEVFDFFKSKDIRTYLEMLQACEDSVKRKHNDVTMSFILLESEKENSWNHCYCLFREMIEFDPRIVKDFTNENITPARRLLVIISCCLKSHHIQEAVSLFLRFGLYEADHSKWLVEKLPGDIDLWMKVCEDLKTAFCSLSQFTDTEAQLFTSIMQHQKSLREPVYLLKGMNNFFEKAANLCEEGGWNAMATIVSTILKEQLFKQLNLNVLELYRILIRAVCTAEDLMDTETRAEICVRLMRKSNKFWGIYPTSWAKECNEITLKTCLTVEEFYAFVYFKMKSFKEYRESKSLHITFEEYGMNHADLKQPYFRDVDCSVKGAIERFKTACRMMDLQPTSLIIHKNKITVDKVIPQTVL